MASAKETEKDLQVAQLSCTEGGNDIREDPLGLKDNALRGIRMPSVSLS